MAGSDLEQWVNVERKKDFVEDEIAAEERLSAEIKFECKFKKAKAAAFKVRVVPLSSQAVYTKKERGRNPNFKLQNLGTKEKQEGKEVRLEAKRALPCAGGNRYQIEAKYKDKVVQSKKVLAARRRFFYQVLSMQGITPHTVSGMEQDFWSPGKNYFVKLVEKGPRNTIKFLKTLHGNNYMDLIRAAKAGYSLEKRRPYAFTLVFSNFIADYGLHKHKDDIDLALPSRIASWKAGTAGQPTAVQSKVSEYIWYGMDPDHDKQRFWLVDNQSRFVTEDGKEIPVPDGDIDVVGPPDFALDGYTLLEIKLSPRLRHYFNSRKGKLKVRLELRVVAGWTLGFSFNEINLITVANYVQWQPADPAGRAQTLDHEMGHKIGMVPPDEASRLAAGPAGTKGWFQQFLPDGPPTVYGVKPGDDRTHQGPHCGKGAVWTASLHVPGDGNWTGAPQCVMFGADGAWSGTTLNQTPKEFCPECQKIVRKLDLDPSHLNGFKKSVKDY